MNLRINQITKCRICTDTQLNEILDLGLSEISSYFPKSDEADPPRAPLVLVQCGNCGLVQLQHNVDQDFLFGNTYGYRTGLTPTMQSHVESLARWLSEAYRIVPGSKVLDIGSNDGTFLNILADQELELYGVDPNYDDMAHYYRDNILGKKAFFDANLFVGLKFDLITSIAMFYDINDPVNFALQIKSVLSKNGIWFLEQSYLMDMLENNSFDTICHEHLMYYSLDSLSRVMSSAELKIIGIRRSMANGGSLGIVVSHVDSNFETDEMVESLLSMERNTQHNLISNFKAEVLLLRSKIEEMILQIRSEGKTIWGVGASTKGNTILNFLGLNSLTIGAIADKNLLKLGRVTPGTRIPIVEAEDLRNARPDYAIVLPWHFRNFIIEDEKEYLNLGGKLIFPLPNLDIVSNGETD